VPWSLARSLDASGRAASAQDGAQRDDLLRLDLPPDGGTDGRLDPHTASIIGSLYLLSELELLDVVSAAELLAAQRWTLDVRDSAAVAALDDFTSASARWPTTGVRAQLYSRLFGAVHPDHAAANTSMSTPNAEFEELLAMYAHAIVVFADSMASIAQRQRASSVSAGFRSAGGRLRSNLAVRQYGNTTIIAAALIEQLRASLDLLAEPGIGALFSTSGAWNVLRAMHGAAGGDIGRHVDRGQAGSVVIASVGYPTVPDLIDSSLVEAATLWLTATGFDTDSGV
jgi:hypothetical protein